MVYLAKLHQLLSDIIIIYKNIILIIFLIEYRLYLFKIIDIRINIKKYKYYFNNFNKSIYFLMI